mmetsp:Transcript_34900/g.104056  ORF Transcript_34900/g.104056 Transcript_34900/m.104056 type:complete len:88 (+) Transcript_34900:2474-2737(+)
MRMPRPGGARRNLVHAYSISPPPATPDDPLEPWGGPPSPRSVIPFGTVAINNVVYTVGAKSVRCVPKQQIPAQKARKEGTGRTIKGA